VKQKQNLQNGCHMRCHQAFPDRTSIASPGYLPCLSRWERWHGLSRDGEGTAATISSPQHLSTHVILSKRSASKDLGITIAAQCLENAWIPPRGCALVGMTGAVAAPLCAIYRNDRAIPASATPCLSRWERWHGIAVTERVQQQRFPYRSIF